MKRELEAGGGGQHDYENWTLKYKVKTKRMKQEFIDRYEEKTIRKLVN